MKSGNWLPLMLVAALAPLASPAAESAPEPAPMADFSQPSPQIKAELNAFEAAVNKADAPSLAKMVLNSTLGDDLDVFPIKGSHARSDLSLVMNRLESLGQGPREQFIAHLRKFGKGTFGTRWIIANFEFQPGMAVAKLLRENERLLGTKSPQQLRLLLGSSIGLKSPYVIDADDADRDAFVRLMKLAYPRDALSQAADAVGMRDDPGAAMSGWFVVALFESADAAESVARDFYHESRVGVSDEVARLSAMKYVHSCPQFSGMPAILVYAERRREAAKRAKTECIFDARMAERIQAALPDPHSVTQVVKYLDAIKAQTGGRDISFCNNFLISMHAGRFKNANARQHGKPKAWINQLDETERALVTRIAAAGADSDAQALLTGVRFLRSTMLWPVPASKTVDAGNTAGIVAELKHAERPATERLSLVAEVQRRLRLTELRADDELWSAMLGVLRDTFTVDMTSGMWTTCALGLTENLDNNDPDRIRAREVTTLIKPALGSLIGANTGTETARSLVRACATSGNVATLSRIRFLAGDRMKNDAAILLTLMDANLPVADWLDLNASQKPYRDGLGCAWRDMPWAKVPQESSPDRFAYLVATVAERRYCIEYRVHFDADDVAFAKAAAPRLRQSKRSDPFVNLYCARVYTGELQSAIVGVDILRESADETIIADYLKEEHDGFSDESLSKLRLVTSLALAEFAQGDEARLKRVMAKIEATSVNTHSGARGHELASQICNMVQRELCRQMTSDESGPIPEWVLRLQPYLPSLLWYEAGCGSQNSESELFTHFEFYAAMRDPEGYNRFIAGLSPEALKRYREAGRHRLPMALTLNRIFEKSANGGQVARMKILCGLKTMPEAMAHIESGIGQAPAWTGVLRRFSPRELVLMEPGLLTPGQPTRVTLDEIVAHYSRKKPNPEAAAAIFDAIIARTPDAAYRAEVILKKAAALAGPMKQPEKARAYLAGVKAEGLPADFEARRTAALAALPAAKS